jgi:hypothetical protein
MEQLPDSILPDVLVYLPLADMVRSRGVCKGWRLAIHRKWPIWTRGCKVGEWVQWGGAAFRLWEFVDDDGTESIHFKIYPAQSIIVRGRNAWGVRDMYFRDWALHFESSALHRAFSMGWQEPVSMGLCDYTIDAPAPEEGLLLQRVVLGRVINS